MKLLNTQQYLAIRKESLINDNREPTASNDYDLVHWGQNQYTDWQKVLLGGTAPISDINLWASGGNGTTLFRLGGSYHKQGTVFPGDFGYHKISGGINLNHLSSNKKLNLDFSLNYGVDSSNLFANGSNSLFNTAVVLPPNAPKIYNEDGTLHWEGWKVSPLDNPMATILHRNISAKSNHILSNLGFYYHLKKNLKFKTTLGYTNLIHQTSGKTSNKYYPPESRDKIPHSSSWSNTKRQSWIIEPQLVYNASIKEGEIDGLFGITFQESNDYKLNISARGYVTESLIGNLAAAESIQINTNEDILYRYNSTFARLGYNWKHKYFINLTGRRDGSSRFGPEKHFANFGAIGGAWILSEEKFLKNKLPSLSFAKIRGSYGITGSDQIGDYGYLDAYETTSGPGGLIPTQLTNPDYSWEENKKLEIALNLGFLENRINLGINWYRNRSSNQLVGYPLPSITGFNTIQSNLPATVQNTGLEVEFSSLNIKSDKLRWQTFINITVPNNKLISFPNIEQTSYINQYRVGHPLNISFLYQYDGIDPETKLYQVSDINNDGSYNFEDRIIYKNLGRKFYGGINNVISSKNFGFNFYGNM